MSEAEIGAAIGVFIVAGIVIGFLALIVFLFSPRKRPSDYYEDKRLSIEQERNQIMREALELKRFETYMRVQKPAPRQSDPMLRPMNEQPPIIRKGEVAHYKKPVIVAPDPDAAKRAEHYEELIEKVTRLRESKPRF